MLHSDPGSYAFNQVEVFLGTAGTLLERTNASGFRFYAHQSYGGEGRKKETYVAGPVGDPEADATAENLKVRIQELKDIVPSLRLLARS